MSRVNVHRRPPLGAPRRVRMSRWALRRMLALGALATVLTVGALTVLHMGAVL